MGDKLTASLKEADGKISAVLSNGKVLNAVLQKDVYHLKCNLSVNTVRLPYYEVSNEKGTTVYIGG